MKVEFEIVNKTFVNKENQEIKYYVLKKTLVDGTAIEVPIKSDKCRLLLLSIAIEKNK